MIDMHFCNKDNENKGIQFKKSKNSTDNLSKEYITIKFGKIKLSKIELRDQLIRNRITPEIDVHSFNRMNLKINNETISGQTILRRFGDGTRTARNFASLLSWLGILSKYNTNNYDYFDPSLIKAVILKSEIDMRTIRFSEFLKKKIVTDKFIGTGKQFIIEIQKAVKTKLENKEEIIPEFLKLSRMNLRGNKVSVPYVTSFKSILSILGVNNIFYSSLANNPEVLREILNSADVDFENTYITLKWFYKLRFSTKISKNTIISYKDIITGQSLAKRVFGTTKLRVSDIIQLLRMAGYNPKTIPQQELKIKLKDPVILREILKSRSDIDYSKLTFTQFKYVKFDCPYFRGVGYTILSKYERPHSNTFRKILRVTGLAR